MKLTDEKLIERFGMRRYGEFEEQIYELLLRQKAEIERLTENCDCWEKSYEALEAELFENRKENEVSE